MSAASAGCVTALPASTEQSDGPALAVPGAPPPGGRARAQNHDCAGPPMSDSVQLELAILAAAAAPDEAAGTGTADEHACAILLLAADPDMRGFLRVCLCRRPGTVLFEAADIAAAAAVARERRPQLVIADAMADSALTGWSGAPLLLLVDEPVPAGGAGGAAAGNNVAFLTKPFSPGRLCEAAETLLSARAQAARGAGHSPPSREPR